MNSSTLGLLVHHQLPEFIQLMSIELVMPSSHLLFCHPFLLLPQSFPASEFFPVSQLCMRWPKYWSFSFSISPFNEHPGLISFRMDWLDLLAVQRTLKSLLQHHSSEAPILWHSAFFTVQISHPYMTTGKTKASSDNHISFLHLFLWGMVLITASCTMSWTSVHSSSGTLSIRSNPLNLFVTSTV